MITDIITGVFVGGCIALVGTYLFVFYAKRRGWMSVQISPNPRAPGASMDHQALMNLYDKYDELDARLKDTSNLLDDLNRQLEPYLNAESKKNKGD